MTGKELTVRLMFALLLTAFVLLLLLVGGSGEVHGEEEGEEEEYEIPDIDCRLECWYNLPADEARGVAVDGNYVYLTNRDTIRDSLTIFDVNDTANPQIVGSCKTEGQSMGIVVKGDYAYLAEWNKGFAILDISNKSDPHVVGSYETERYVQPEHLAVDGDYAYLAVENDGLIILDINNKTNPSFVAEYDPSHSVGNVEVHGDHAYLAADDGGLLVLDISNRSDPQLLGQLAFEDTDDVDVIGDFAYLATYHNLTIVDVSVKTAPVLVAQCDTGSSTKSIATSGDHAFITCAEEGIAVVSIGNPGDPRIRGRYDTPFFALDVEAKDNHVFVADEDGSLVIVEMGPMAWFDEMSTNQSILLKGESVVLKGSGTGYGGIQHYILRSDRDGELYNGTEEPDFRVNTLSQGRHKISLKVQDDYGVWSDERSFFVTLHERPTAQVDSVTPGTVLEGESIEFNGTGWDDGTITTYVWSSSIDGEFHNSTEANFSTAGLSSGNHNISFRVQDNYKVWSEPVSSSVEVLKDSDGDKVADEDDAFPTDPAASKDTDGDGYPDEWNAGNTAENSTTGLKLDEFPEDPEKWEKEGDDGGGDDGPGFELAFLVMAVVATLLLGGPRGRRR